MIELLQISTLGKVSIKLGETALDEVLSAKAQALLIYLASNGGNAQTRRCLAELFWYERSEEQGLSNLRTLLSRIRPQLGAFLIVNRDTVAFDNTQPFQLDLTELQQILTRARPYLGLRASSLPAEIAINLEKGVALYKGEFLADFHPPDAGGFEEWADGERQNLQTVT